MNRSGEAVAQAVAELGVDDIAGDLLVAFDESTCASAHVPAPGGRRGAAMRPCRRDPAAPASDFARLRFGSGLARAPETADYVLVLSSAGEQSVTDCSPAENGSST